MSPIMATVPTLLSVTLGLSLVAPVVGAAALCCAALVYDRAQRSRDRAGHAITERWVSAHTVCAGNSAC